MSPPAPPVPLKNQCSIIHDNVLYVYSPDAFQVLPLAVGGQWKQQPNGVSVTGATCVKGGIDGDNSQAALYVIGGVTNSSSVQYAGLQRYSISNGTWESITPVVPVTQNRVNHGTAYMNASSSIVVYAGSQNGYTGPSTETFLIELYPPYRVQAYSSIAPPTVDPMVLTYSDDHAVMVGGSSTNVNVFTFGPAEGWADLGVALTAALPAQTDAQCAILTLDDDSKILETFYLNQSPNLVTRTVIANPGGAQAAYNETAGSPTTPSVPSSAASSSSRKRKRGTYLTNFPSYNDTFAPTTTRIGFSVAQDGNGLVTIVGGDQTDSVAFFDQIENGWLDVNQILGSSSRTSQIPQKPSVLPSSSPPSGSTSTANSSASQSHSLVILGAVLGAICGLAAILLVALLWLRSIRRKRRAAERNQRNSEYPQDQKRENERSSFDDGHLQPLSQQGKPMGRSPVPSTVPSDEVMLAAMGGKSSENTLEDRPAGSSGNPSNLNGRLKLDSHGSEGIGFGPGIFNKQREKSPLAISRPFAPDLGHYQDRPSIELGKATPAALAPTAAVPMRNISQRKTDEGWGKYFQAGKDYRPDETMSTWTSDSSRPTSSRSKGTGGFWPGSGVPEKAPRSPKIPLRDSTGAALNTGNVAAASPSMETGPADNRSRHLAVARGIPARISTGTASTTGTDDSLEDLSVVDDDEPRPYSSGMPANTHDAWTPVGNTWSGPPQRPLRPPSSPNNSYPHTFFPPPTNASEGTSTSNGTKRSSIPSFPMPSSSIRHVKKLSQDNNTRSALPPTLQHSAANHFKATTAAGAAPMRPPRPAEDVRDYFGPGPGRDGVANNSDMSWLNLGGGGEQR